MLIHRLLRATLAGLLPALLLPAAATAVVAADDERFVVVRNATIVPVEGKLQKKATIIISEGKITNIGPSIEYPRNARVIDAEGMYVMPGLIYAETRAGLPSPSRRGVHGDLLAADEYHPRAGQFDDLLDAGVTTIGLLPTGAGIPGRAAIMQTAGDEDERFLQREGYLYVTSSKSELREALKKAKAEIEKVEKARKEFDEKQKAEAAKAKQEAARKEAEKKDGQPEARPAPASQPTSQPTTQPAKFEPPKIDPAYQPLVDLLKDKTSVPILLEASQAAEILHLNEVLDEFEIDPHWTLRNNRQSDLFKVAEEIARTDETRVVLRAGRHRVPYSAERLPLIQMIAAAGCEVSLVPYRDNAYEYGNLLARVAELVREGWDRDTALASVTLHPARLLGIDETRGSIKKDKVADLIFLDADPLAPGARVRKVMIAGEIVHEVEDEQ